MMIKTPLLDKVSFPKDLKKFNQAELKTVSKELRNEMIDAYLKLKIYLMIPDKTLNSLKTIV